MSDDPLDQVNRAVIAIVALLLIFVAVLAVLIAWAEPLGAIGKLEDFTEWLRDHETREAKLILTLGAVVVVLLMAGVILIELTPSPTQKMRLRTVKAGDATITTLEIAGRIEEDLSSVPEIAAAQAVVAAKGQKVEVVLDVQVQPGADLARTADDACGRAHRLVEDEMGVTLASLPRARLRYRELQLRPQQTTKAPAAAEAPPSTGWERPGGTDDRGN